MEEERGAESYSELRYIVIELMKLAAAKGTTFDEELSEFVKNAYKLRMAVVYDPSEHSSRKPVHASKQKK